MSIKISEIARKIGMDNSQLLHLLKERGFDVHSVSSTIDNITAEAILNDFAAVSSPPSIAVVNHPQGRPIHLREEDRLVFVISSFKEEMEVSYAAIKAAADSVGLVAKRVKDIEGDFKITDKIMEMIERSRFVVADLSHERPNVYFELGYARGIKKTVVTILKKGHAIHFDVKDWNYIEYADSRDLENTLKRRFSVELSR
jgi:nucleoside 2-deoxyribosyltransferase